MSLQLQPYIPVFLPTQIQAGREHIQTVLLYITLRSLSSVVMQTRCLPGKKLMASGKLRGEFQKVLPVVNTEGSDSAITGQYAGVSGDGGMDLPLAVMIMIPGHGQTML